MIQESGLISPFKRVRGLFYGWWMSVLAGLIMAISIVPIFQGMAIWNPVLRGRFGWTPDQLQWAFAFTRIEGGIMGPIEGFLVERLGSRRMVLIGLLMLGAGFLMFSRIDELWQLFGVFVLMSLGAALGSWLPMMTVLNHWFVRQRSRAMGLAMEGWAIGGIVLLPLMAWAIGGIEGDQPERFGWRATAAGIGAIIILLAFPFSRLVRNRPEEYGYHPDGDKPAQAVEKTAPSPASLPAAGEGGLTWQEALRTKSFWIISIGHGASTIIPVSVAVHLGLILDDRGISLQMMAWIVVTTTGVSAIFHTCGWLHRGPDGHTLCHLLVLILPVGGRINSRPGREHSHGIPLCVGFGNLFWGAYSPDDGCPGSLLWTQGLCRHHGDIHGALERDAARGTPFRRLHVQV